jgi:hypothetical protein
MERIAISPEPLIEKCRSLARAERVYLDVVDGRVRLGWMGGSEEGFMNRVEAFRLGISYEMLLEALEEVGGETSMNGRYPVNNAIRQRLTKLFKTK